MDNKNWITKLKLKLRRSHSVILIPIVCSIILFTLFVGVDKTFDLSSSSSKHSSLKGNRNHESQNVNLFDTDEDSLQLKRINRKSSHNINDQSNFGLVLNLSNTQLIESFNTIPLRTDKAVKDESEYKQLGISEIEINDEIRFISDDISVVIPVSSSDWFLLPLVLDSILKQSVLPKEVIISFSNSVNNNNYYEESQVHPIKLFASKSGTSQTKRTAADALINSSKSGRRPSDNDDVEANKMINDLLNILEQYPDTIELLAYIPNAVVLDSQRPAYAGSNRENGYKQCSGTIIAFFDSDDIMHPRRIETLHSAFRYHEEIEGLVHGFEYTYLNEFSSKYNKWFNATENDIEIGWNNALDLPLEHRANDMYKHYDRSHDYDDPDDWKWFFPDEILISHNPELYQQSFQNGWLTVRKSVLENIKFPDTARGQDTRLLYRLLQESDLKLAFLKSELGLYVRPNGVKRRRVIETWLIAEDI